MPIDGIRVGSSYYSQTKLQHKMVDKSEEAAELAAKASKDIPVSFYSELKNPDAVIQYVIDIATIEAQNDSLRNIATSNKSTMDANDQIRNEFEALIGAMVNTGAYSGEDMDNRLQNQARAFRATLQRFGNERDHLGQSRYGGEEIHSKIVDLDSKPALPTDGSLDSVVDTSYTSVDPTLRAIQISGKPFETGSNANQSWFEKMVRVTDIIMSNSSTETNYKPRMDFAYDLAIEARDENNNDTARLHLAVENADNMVKFNENKLVSIQGELDEEMDSNRAELLMKQVSAQIDSQIMNALVQGQIEARKSLLMNMKI